MAYNPSREVISPKRFQLFYYSHRIHEKNILKRFSLREVGLTAFRPLFHGLSKRTLISKLKLMPMDD